MARLRAVTRAHEAWLQRLLINSTSRQTEETASKMQVSESAITASIQELFIKAGVRSRNQLVRSRWKPMLRFGWETLRSPLVRTRYCNRDHGRQHAQRRIEFFAEGTKQSKGVRFKPAPEAHRITLPAQRGPKRSLVRGQLCLGCSEIKGEHLHHDRGFHAASLTKEAS